MPLVVALEKRKHVTLALDIDNTFFPQSTSSFDVIGAIELAPRVRLVVRRSMVFHGRSLGITHGLEHDVPLHRSALLRRLGQTLC